MDRVSTNRVSINSFRAPIQRSAPLQQDENYDEIHGDSEGILEALASLGIEFEPRIEPKRVETAMIPYWLNGQIS